MTKLAQETIARMKSALDDDLNTAQAQAAIFEMVRAANAAADGGTMKKGDSRPLLDALTKFDEIFAVIKDDDAAKMRSVLEWASAVGREKDVSAELRDITASSELSDEAIDQKVAAMNAARKARRFQESDAIRAELNAAGIIVEITKDGVRWRRK
jgi:cysteinyl-tRNA synthetase